MQRDLTQPVLPCWTWADLGVVLLEMARTPEHRALVEHLTEGLRRDAIFLTPAGVLRELSVIVVAVCDPLPASSDEEAPMT